MAASFLIRKSLHRISGFSTKIPTVQLTTCPLTSAINMQTRASSKVVPPPVTFGPKYAATDDIDVNKQPMIVIRKNPPEWKYVERVLGRKTVPEPVPKEEYPSGWRPQQPEARSYSYFIRRTKNHMVPVYLHLGFRNSSQRTVVKNIEGDIWELHQELFDFVSNYMARKQRTRVDEYAGKIVFNGDHVNLIKEYLMSKGF